MIKYTLFFSNKESGLVTPARNLKEFSTLLSTHCCMPMSKIMPFNIMANVTAERINYFLSPTVEHLDIIRQPQKAQINKYTIQCPTVCSTLYFSSDSDLNNPFLQKRCCHNCHASCQKYHIALGWILNLTITHYYRSHCILDKYSHNILFEILIFNIYISLSCVLRTFYA